MNVPLFLRLLAVSILVSNYLVGAAAPSTLAGAVAAGENFSAAVAQDGTVWCWPEAGRGAAALGQQNRPFHVPSLTNTTALAGGENFVALKQDGSVWSWTPRSLPNGEGWIVEPTVIPVLEKVVAIAASAQDGLALTTEGTVWAWTLAPMEPAGGAHPVEMVGLSDIAAVDTSENLSAARQRNGDVFMWLPASSDQSLVPFGRSPTKLPHVGDGTVASKAIAVGARFLASVLADGSVWVWSEKSRGAAEEQDAADRWAWRQIDPLPAIAQVAASGERLVMVGQAGEVWTWRADVSAPPVRLAQVERVVGAAIAKDWGYLVRGDGTVLGWSEREPWLMGDGSRVPLPPGRLSLFPIRLQVEPGDANANGVPDEWEINFLGDVQHPIWGDSDGDGVSEVREFYQESNPTITDEDGDGLSDAVDLYPRDSFNGSKPLLNVRIPPGGYLDPKGLVEILVTDEAARPLVGAGLDFRIGGEIATIGASPGEATQTGFSARTDEKGVARVYVSFRTYKPDLVTVIYLLDGKFNQLPVEVKPPRVVLARPKSRTIFQTPTAIRLEALVADASNLRAVEFYAGTQKIGEVLTPPFRFVWTGAPPANYDLSAVATWLDGESVVSQSVWVQVVPTVNLPPYVRLLTPSNALELPRFRVGDAVLLRALASDADGIVKKVEFFVGAQKQGECRQEPYEISLSEIPVGQHQLTAKAYDEAGGVRVSDYVEVVVAPVPVDMIRVGFEEDEGFVEGGADGQQDWNGANVEITRHEDGGDGRWLRVVGANPAATARRSLPRLPPSAGICFYAFKWRPVAGDNFAEAAKVRVGGSELAVMQENGRSLLVLGKVKERRRLDLGDRVAQNGTRSDGGWLSLLVREDLRAGRWDCYLDGKMVAADVPSWTRPQNELEIAGHRTEPVYFDEFRMTLVNPLFADADRDGLPDAWEIKHRLDPTGDDRAGDLDRDGLSNAEEFLENTSPSDEDSDHDGLRDGWEKNHGFSPLIAEEPASLTLDEDQDGLNLKQESAAGTDPRLPDTDGDGLSDGVEVSYRLDPLTADAAADTDGDGVANASEIAANTDPADYYNGAQPIVTQLGSDDDPLIEGRYLAFLVTDADQKPLKNAPLKRKADGTTYGFAPTWENRWSGAKRELEVRTDQAGIAKFYVVRVDELIEPLK